MNVSDPEFDLWGPPSVGSEISRRSGWREVRVLKFRKQKPVAIPELNTVGNSVREFWENPSKKIVEYLEVFLPATNRGKRALGNDVFLMS